MELYLFGLIALAFGAFAWPWMAKRNTKLTGWLAAVIPTLLFIWLLVQVNPVSAGLLPAWSGEWVPELGVSLDFKLDGPGLLLSLLISGIGALVLIYGGAYLTGSTQAPPFFAFVQIFMFAMLGVSASDNLLLLFVFWELTSIASYFLIGLAHSEASARKSALRALLITGAGGLALLAGILLLGEAGGTFSISELQKRSAIVQADSRYTAILILVLLGAFTKSAQFPFHFWLPDAMAAPTPVSAYLHSATMVKAGVFLLAKLTPVLSGTILWHETLTVIGSLTMFFGALFALAQSDIKRLLAYSTMSALGTLVLLLGIGTELAIKAAMVFLVVHALYKAPLFMIAGIVDKAAGTRDVTLLEGLGRRLPSVAVAAALAAFSMSGVPPLIGFIGKELLYEAQTNADSYSSLITVLGFAANAINVAVALKVGFSPFRGSQNALAFNSKAKQRSLLLGPLLLSLMGLWVGLFPSFLSSGLINPATRDIVGIPIEADLKLWHGFNFVLLLGALTVVVGFLVYWFWDQTNRGMTKVFDRIPFMSSKMFDTGVYRMVKIAGQVTQFFQHGNLRLYLVVLLLSFTALLGLGLSQANWTIFSNDSPVRFVPLAISVLTACAGIAAIRSKSTIMAILAMGGVGYGTALLFALFGAPDLALTQVLVETLTLVLFSLVIRQLPPLEKVSLSTPQRRYSDLGIAVVAGTALTLALLAVRAGAIPMPERISAEMATRSLPEAHGKNVVNVILVDFRALDTMGEICVLAIAALGVAGLLLGPKRRNRQAEFVIATPLFRVAMAWITPLLMGMAIFLLFRGHNEPGGGFIGGLVAGASLMLRRMSNPTHAFHSGRLPLIWISLGLLTAFLSTLPSILLGETFMKGVWVGSLWLPLVGNTKFGTPFLFDIGVFLVVVGVCLLILTRLMRNETSLLAIESEEEK